jgi:hypothetical protein
LRVILLLLQYDLLLERLYLLLNATTWCWLLLLLLKACIGQPVPI